MIKLFMLLATFLNLSVFAATDPFADLEKLIGTTGTTTTTNHGSAAKVLDQASDKWKYAGVEQIVASGVTNDSITILTTEVMYNNVSVEKYRIYYAESSLSTIQDTSKIKDIIVTPSEKKNTMVTLKLSGLKENTTYYIVVSPVDPTNPSAEALSMISDEISVKTTAPAVVAPTALGLENVSYTYKDNTVTLTRSPLATTTNVDVQVRHQSETSYKKVGTVKGSVGKMSFDISKSGNYFLKMAAMDSNGAMVGKEHIQTFKVDSVEAPKNQPVVQTAPKVGPASNLLFGIAFFSILFYFIYRFRRIEA